MKTKQYWLRRRDQLFLRMASKATTELAAAYKELFNQTSSNLLLLLDEIDKGIVHQGSINEREVLVSDLYKADKWFSLLNDYTIQLTKLGSKEVVGVSKILTEMFYKQSELTTTELGNSKSFTFFSPEEVNNTINAVWCQDGKAWSDRVWLSKTEMANELRQGIIDIVAGGNMTSDRLAEKLVPYLKDEINKGFNRAVRLVHTELSYVQTQSTLKRYQQAGVEYYEILAANGACSDCAMIWNGKKIRVDEAIVGVNCPPFHPNCRCTTLAVLGG